VTDGLKDKFNRSLAKTESTKCWSIVAGKGAGSVINIGFGGKIKRDKPLSNPALGEQDKLFEAEFSLLVYCAWRLSNDVSIICSWRDDNSPNGPMLKGLSILQNKKVVGVSLDMDMLDLTLIFEDGLRLDIFCDQTNTDESDQNYIFYTSQMIFTAGIPNNLSADERKPHKLVLHD
jgi:hypothetical protein